eukprot:Opistho-2@62783
MTVDPTRSTGKPHPTTNVFHVTSLKLLPIDTLTTFCQTFTPMSAIHENAATRKKCRRIATALHPPASPVLSIPAMKMMLTATSARHRFMTSIEGPVRNRGRTRNVAMVITHPAIEMLHPTYVITESTFSSVDDSESPDTSKRTANDVRWSHAHVTEDADRNVAVQPSVLNIPVLLLHHAHLRCASAVGSIAALPSSRDSLNTTGSASPVTFAFSTDIDMTCDRTSCGVVGAKGLVVNTENEEMAHDAPGLSLSFTAVGTTNSCVRPLASVKLYVPLGSDAGARMGTIWTRAVVISASDARTGHEELLAAMAKPKPSVIAAMDEEAPDALSDTPCTLR